MKEHHNNVSDTIHRICYNDKQIIIIATAHVSKKSQEEVKNVIETEKPDCVGVELDYERYKTLKEKNAYSSMDIIKVIKEGKAIIVFVKLLLASYQKKIAKDMGVEPGCEMIQAIKSAEENNATLAFVDRDIQITFKRIWRKSNFFQKFKLINQIFGSLFITGNSIKEEDIEQMKKSDMLEGAIHLIGKSFPLISEVLIDERDRFIANKIRSTEGNKIVVVLGAAHVPGVKKYLSNVNLLVPERIEEKVFKKNILAKLPNNEKDYLKNCYIAKRSTDIHKKNNNGYYWLKDSLENEIKEKIFNIVYNGLPKPGMLGKVFAAAIPTVLLAWIVYGFFNNTGIENILSYILGTGCGAALGSLFSLAHPITVLVAFIAAPITVMHPLLGVGWFTGLSEAMLKKPKISDLESLSADIKTLKGLYHNRFSRTLLVIFCSSLGTNIGVFFGIPFMNKVVSTIIKSFY